MFAVRGIAVSASVFFLVYVALSAAVVCVWKKLDEIFRYDALQYKADFLFSLRMMPLVLALLITAAFTVPSFVVFEPRAIVEPLGGALLILGFCGLALAMFGAGNALIAFWRAFRLIDNWLAKAEPVRSESAIPVLRVTEGAPAMTAAGVLRSRVFFSAAAHEVLRGNELQMALRHETSHARRHDNLKKLLFRFAVFPGMAGLETAWTEVCEMAADDAAVGNANEALDLASALIKISQISLRERSYCEELMTSFAQGPSALIQIRVRRLIGWTAPQQVPQRFSPWFAANMMIIAAAAFFLTYSHMLREIHTATEWLVK